MNLLRVRCIKAANSIAFVEHVFSSYSEKRLFAISSYDSSDEFSRHTGLHVDEYLEPSQKGGWINFNLRFPEDRLPAQIVFTSGTEGTPKAIVLSYENLSDVVCRINGKMEVTEEIREYIGVPVYHSFGLGRCRAIAAVGGSAFIPSNGFDLRELRAMLEDGSINAISAVPSLWRTVLASRNLFEGVQDKVRWIEIGSQYMSGKEKLALKNLFPRAKIVQHYGLTEASRTALLRVDQAEMPEVESVGCSSDKISVKVCEDGRLAIKGPNVAMGKLIDGELVPLVDSEGWFVTSDLAEITDGSIYYGGRADDIINLSGVKLDPLSVELILNVNKEIRDHVYLCRIPDVLRGEGVLVVWRRESTNDPQEILRQVEKVLAERKINIGTSLKFYVTEEIPVTPTGKIKRKAIVELYRNENLFESEVAQAESAESVEGLYKNIFGVREIKHEDTFVGLGGGSLNYIMASVSLERIIGPLPPSWEKMTVKALELRKNGGGSASRLWASLETSVVVRAYAVVAVVMNHSGLTFLAGGAALLMLAAGLNFGRFQWDSCVSLRFGNVLKSILIHVLVPYWVLLIAFPLLKSVPVDISYIFLMGNNIPGKIDAPFPAWFVAALVQALCIFIFPLFFSPARRWIKSKPFAYGVGMLMFAVILRIWDGWYGWGQEYGLSGMQITWVFWLFALGFCAYHTRGDLVRKIFMTIVMIVTPSLFYFADWSRVLTVAIGGGLLLWAPSIRVPAICKSVVGLVGASSLFIYLLHSRAPVELVPRLLGVDWPRIIVGIGVGVIGWIIYTKVVDHMLRYLSPYGSRLKAAGTSFFRSKL